AARGPKLTIGEEQQLDIKLVQPVYTARSESNQLTASTPVEQPHQSPSFVSVSRSPTLECPGTRVASGRILVPSRSRIVRSFQNTTPYDVVVYGNGVPIGMIAPCSESVLLLPRSDLKLKAVATIPEDDGQREIEVGLGLNDRLTGWQVLSPQTT